MMPACWRKESVFIADELCVDLSESLSQRGFQSIAYQLWQRPPKIPISNQASIELNKPRDRRRHWEVSTDDNLSEFVYRGLGGIIWTEREKATFCPRFARLNWSKTPLSSTPCWAPRSVTWSSLVLLCFNQRGINEKELSNGLSASARAILVWQCYFDSSMQQRKYEKNNL